MAYLSKLDYTIDISIEDLDKILLEAARATTKTEDAVREEAELYAQAKIEAHLKDRYDITGEFAKQSTDPTRSRMVMKCMISISLFLIHSTINPRNIPALRNRNYEDCLNDLAAMQSGDLSLIGVSEVEDPLSFTVIESTKKFISKPFQDPQTFE